MSRKKNGKNRWRDRSEEVEGEDEGKEIEKRRALSPSLCLVLSPKALCGQECLVEDQRARLSETARGEATEGQRGQRFERRKKKTFEGHQQQREKRRRSVFLSRALARSLLVSASSRPRHRDRPLLSSRGAARGTKVAFAARRKEERKTKERIDERCILSFFFSLFASVVVQLTFFFFPVAIVTGGG